MSKRPSSAYPVSEQYSGNGKSKKSSNPIFHEYGPRTGPGDSLGLKPSTQHGEQVLT
jgi:hypothetical protein